jgi:glycosyltransferase involved in cell wall biosynthesis
VDSFYKGYGMPLVSVILPCRNRASTLKRAIDSVLKQTFSDLELVIVDDGSTDQSQEIFNYLADERVRCYQFAQSRGAAAARNHGIEATTSPFVAFQDSDDEWHPDKLSIQLEAIKSANVGLVYSHMLRVSSSGIESIFLAPEPTFEDIYDVDLQKYSLENIGIQSCLIDRESFKRSGLFDESLPALEDLDLFIRLTGICGFKRLDVPLVKYHESDGLSTNVEAQAKARRMLFQKYKQAFRGNKKAVAIELMRITELERHSQC